MIALSIHRGAFLKDSVVIWPPTTTSSGGGPTSLAFLLLLTGLLVWRRGKPGVFQPVVAGEEAL
jgi:uncharacterized protein (TIGR03382 family)